MARIFVVDDEMTMVQTVTELLRDEGHEVVPFNSGHEAMEALDVNSPDLIITDLFLQRAHPQGLELLGKAKALNPSPVVIVITGYASIETAVEAMKAGAYDYLEKPFQPDDFVHCVNRALSYNKAISENTYLRKQLRDKYQFDQIVGNSSKIQGVYKLMERIANTDSTILILGESGTGKELVARALHFNGRRQFAPFIPVNCSALPENLLESELFGHCKGAFTGAIADKKGLFQEADGGTIFLDEVGSMPLFLQSRLLRVLQDKEIRRVGENTPLRINVRVLAATNEPLEKRISEGLFREDLYYRLNVIPIRLPPLRDRKDDIPLLVSHFLRTKCGSRNGKSIRISRQVLRSFELHDWPGNVRELENIIERGVALCENSTIRIQDLPPFIQEKAAQNEIHEVEDNGGDFVMDSEWVEMPLEFEFEGRSFSKAVSNRFFANGTLSPLKEFMHEQELAYLKQALVFTRNDKEKAASVLGISLATLYRKLAESD